MNGARFVHDRLELAGWRVEIADAQKVKGLAPLACKTDRIDAWVLAELSHVPLLCTVPGISWVLAYTIAADPPGVKNPHSALGMVSDAFNDGCRNFARRRSCAGGGPAQHLWQLPRTRPKGYSGVT